MSRQTLDALAESGFKTEERDPRWLYKAWKYDVLVDVICRARQHGIRRVLSLFFFAESRDMWIPPASLRELIAALHDQESATR